MQTHEIRQRFIDHYVKAGHTHVPSASLVLEDPTLLFVNAGMVPFKPYFLGQQTAPFSTATSIQKCVRTLDIDEVGITTRHNTFFQMAGNFSFGAYFKEGAIKHAWSLLTSPVDEGGYGFDPDSLWATVYKDDDEAYSIWRDGVGMREDHIQRRGMKDNFWSMGVPGPCGPSSEIFFDRGPAYGKEGGPVVDEDRYIEIWNLVFMEKERGEGIGKDGYKVIGSLPQKNIDTGMGIERVAFILQGVENVYETDLLRPTITTAERLTGSTYSDAPEDHQDAVYFRVIADHSRTAVMLIADGVTPGNEGRGYILRRLIRRIVRSARLLGAHGPVMEELTATVCDSMSPSFPELVTKREHIQKLCVTEEKAFLRTLDSGMKLFAVEAAAVKARGEDVIPGDVAFTLHDTHGFPIDLTREMAAEQGMTVDDAAFDRLMQEQKQRAKADSHAKKHAHADLGVYRDFIDQHPTTFTGYNSLTTDTKILGLVVDGEHVDHADTGTHVEVILEDSPFYAEAGGQCADCGTITTAQGCVDVRDVQKIGKKVWLHRGIVTSGTITVGSAQAQVDAVNRRHGAQAHTATHLVHAALRSILGEEAVQAGSLNKPGYLRFDFNWTSPLTPAELTEIEEWVNTAIDQDLPVTTEIMALDDAKASGAMALFGENYGDKVRVVTIGEEGKPCVSKELCGGIHVASTAQIGSVRFIGDSSVGSGIRRVEAYVGLQALAAARNDQRIVNDLMARFKVKSDDVVPRVAALQETVKNLERELSDVRMAAVLKDAGSFIEQAVDINGVQVIAAEAPHGADGAQLRTLACTIRKHFGENPAVVALFTGSGEKLPFVVAVNSSAVSRGVKAGDIVKAVAPAIGGRGGGKPDLAQGSGSDASGLAEALTTVTAAVQKVTV